MTGKKPWRELNELLDDSTGDERLKLKNRKVGDVKVVDYPEDL